MRRFFLSLIVLLLPFAAMAQTAVGTLSSATTAAPYLGQVATRTYQDLSFYAGGAATYQSGRSMHWVRSTAVNPTLVFPCWWISQSHVETVVASTTVKAAIELTLGTRAAQNVEGKAPCINGYAVTTFNNITIPKNTQIWVDYLYESPNGIVFSSRSTSSQDPTEGWQWGTSSTPPDFTVSGTPTFSRGAGYGPILILAQTTDPTLLLIGDSRVQAISDYVSDVTGDIGELGRLFGRRFGYTSWGNSGAALNSYNSSSKTYRSQITAGTIAGIVTNTPYHSHIINEYCGNDIKLGSTAATCATSRAAFTAAYPQHVIFGATLAPNPTSTDNWSTLANQGSYTAFSTFNDLVRAGIAGEQGVIDIADYADPYRTGKWPVSRNPNDAAAATSSFTASVSSYVMTVSGTPTNPILVNSALFGPGMYTGTFIIGQLTGTAGAAGTYSLSQNPPITAQMLTTGGLMIQDGVHEGALAAGLIRDRGAPVMSLITR